MDKPHAFDLYLPAMTESESYFRPDSINEYHESVAIMLAMEKKGLSEEAVKDRAGVDNLDGLDGQFPKRFYRFSYDEKEWFDMIEDILITSKNLLFDKFFAYKIRQTDLKHIWGFLQHHFVNYRQSNITVFSYYLKTVLMKFKDELIDEYRAELIEDWVKEMKVRVVQTPQSVIKHKVKREPDDKLTALNQELTALLIHILQQCKGILRDEYLNNKEAGEAFSKLTGYSAETLRQKLGKDQIERLCNTKNLTEVGHFVTRLNILIENLIRESKSRGDKS